MTALLRPGSIAGGLLHITFVLALLSAAPPPATARTLSVGPNAAFVHFRDANAAALPGDRIEIAAGTYYECAVLSADRLTVEGAGPQTVLTDRTCEGKAILITTGRDITLRNLTLARARAPDGNGAGLRAEAPGLLVRNVRFENNQDGLLASNQEGGALRIEDSVFTRNGSADDPHSTASLVVGFWAILDVRGTRFEAGGGGSQIRSGAALTTVANSHIDSATGGDATIETTGGLVVQDSQIQASGGPGGRHVAIFARPGLGDTLALRRDKLLGDGLLLLNWSGRTALLDGDVMGQGGTEASSAGSWWYWLRSSARTAYQTARSFAGAAVRKLSSIAR